MKKGSLKKGPWLFGGIFGDNMLPGHVGIVS